MPFTSMCKTKNNEKKNKLLNEEHNERIKCYNLWKKIQHNLNNSKFENENRNKRENFQSAYEFKSNLEFHVLILNNETTI